MDRKRLFENAAEARLRHKIATQAGDAATVDLFAAQRFERDAGIRSNFARILSITGSEYDGTFTDTRTTPPIVLAESGDQLGLITARVTISARSGTESGVVTTEFFEDDTPFNDENYEDGIVVALARTRSGDGYGSWAHIGGESDQRSEAIANDMIAADTAMRDAEETQAMLWAAMANPALNPQFAQVIAAQRQAEAGQ